MTSARGADLRPYPRLLVLLGIMLFCGGVWTGLYLAGEHALGATAVELRSLEAINQRLNWSIHYTPAVDFTPNTRAGDCKTYAATKRAQLLRDGWSPDRLVIWAVFDERHARHAVLMVDGGVVLDNRFTWTQTRQTLERFGYRFLGPMTWLDEPAAIATASLVPDVFEAAARCGQ